MVGWMAESASAGPNGRLLARHTAILRTHREPIDAEALIQWALTQTGRLPWLNANDRELSFDQGLNAKPRRKPRNGWTLAQACAGIRLGRYGLVAPMRRPTSDASAVLAAIRRLPPAAAGLVIACGRGGIQPDWMPGVVPVERKVVRRVGKKRRRMVFREWVPCSPEAIRAARAVYREWWDAVAAVAREVEGQLECWEVDGFCALPQPWAQDGANFGVDNGRNTICKMPWISGVRGA